MHPVIESVGEKIKQERKKQGMTQKELCDGICSQAEISKVENGKNSPTIDLLQSICKRLRLPISSFFEDEQVSQKLNEMDQKMLRHFREKSYTEMSRDLKQFAESSSAFEIQFLVQYHGILLEHEKGNIDFRTCISALLQLVSKEKLVDRSFLLYTRIQMAIAVLYTNQEEYQHADQIYDELINMSYQTREYKKIRMKIIYNYVRNLYRMKRFEDGFREVEKAISESKQMQDLTYLGHFYYQKGFLLESLNASESEIKESYTIAYAFFIATKNHAYQQILETHLSHLLLFPLQERE